VVETMIYLTPGLFLNVGFFFIWFFSPCCSAFVNLGLSPDTVFWLLILTLDLPLTTLESHHIAAGQIITYFG
jgi:hypothetical protein